MKNETLNKLLGEPLCNMAQAFLDHFVEANVEQRHRLGVHSVIIRQMLSSCCDWCQNLAGTYDADNAPKDIYRRHDNCKCMVLFKSDKAKYVDVWSKNEFARYRSARISKLATIMGDNVSTLGLKEFIKKYPYERGNIEYSKGFRRSRGVAEIRCAKWLNRLFGGDILLIKDVNKDRIQTPDYLWRGKLWEQKSVSSKNSIDKQLQKGIHQISKNPGGIILEFEELTQLTTEEIREVIINRMNRTMSDLKYDVIVKNGNGILLIVTK